MRLLKTLLSVLTILSVVSLPYGARADAPFVHGTSWVDDGQVKVQREGDAAPGLLVHFPVPARSGLGKVRINFFIPDARIKDNAFGVEVEGYGNGRGFDPYSDAFASKVAIEVDFEAGQGRVFIEPSCIEFPWDAMCQVCKQLPLLGVCAVAVPVGVLAIFGCIGLRGRTQRSCNEPHPITDDPQVGGNYFSSGYRETGDGGFVLDMQLSSTNALSEVALGTPLTCAIDDFIQVYAEAGEPRVVISGDNYPAAEAYWYRGGYVQTLYQRHADARGPSALCDPRSPPPPPPPPPSPCPSGSCGACLSAMDCRAHMACIWGQCIPI